VQKTRSIDAAAFFGGQGAAAQISSGGRSPTTEQAVLCSIEAALREAGVEVELRLSKTATFSAAGESLACAHGAHGGEEVVCAAQSLLRYWVETGPEVGATLVLRGLEASGHHLVCDLLCAGDELPVTWHVRGSVHALRPEWQRRLVLRYEPPRARQHAHHVQQCRLRVISLLIRSLNWLRFTYSIADDIESRCSCFGAGTPCCGTTHLPRRRRPRWSAAC
jgi:hypothetical protein